MRRILLSCAILAVLALLVAASAGAHEPGKTGFLVVKQGAGDGGRPIVTLAVHGFVLGSVGPQDEAQVTIIPLNSAQGAPQVAPTDITPHPVRYGRSTGVTYRGSGFRFRAVGGYYRVVVRGSGVYLFAGGVGNVKLQGSSFDRQGDGRYSIDGKRLRSLPTKVLKRQIGGG